VPCKYSGYLVNRMNEVLDVKFNARREFYSSHVLGNYLECINERRQTDFRRSVLVADNDYSFSLRPGELAELVAITHRAHIARVRMQQIHRPVLRFPSIIAIRSSNLEFYSPFVRDKQIGSSLRSYCCPIFGESI